MMTGNSRLSAWRQFREEYNPDNGIEGILQEFAKIKTLPRYIDYYTPNEWPNVFDIVYEGYICQSGLTLILTATMHELGFINSDNLHFEAISNFETGKDGLVLMQDDLYYNFLPGEAVDAKYVKENSAVFQKFIITSDKLYS